jgi:glycosyltransferase involved in cell wall biosynthesis
MINILHLRDSPWLDGPGRTILETGIAINHEKCGYFVGAFQRAEETLFIKNLLEKGLIAFPIHEKHSLDIGVIKRILDIIKHNRINIIHTHEIRSNLFGLACSKIAKIPIITTFHGWIANSIKGKVYTSIDKITARYFDHIIAVSKAIQEELLRVGIAAEKVTVLHNALVIDRYKPNPEDQQFRNELGIDKNVFLIGNIGRLSPEKGQTDLILAAKQIFMERNDIKIVIIGRGPEKGNIENMIKEFNIENRVILAGFQNDMMKVYNSLNLVVQNSYTEGLPNVVLEASLMGVPVIATDVGGTSEVIEDGTTGILVSPGNPKEMADKILECTKNPDHMKTMGRLGRAKVQKEFDLQQRTKKLTRIYEDLIAQPTNQ